MFWREVKLVDHKPNKVAIENLFINENENSRNTICDFGIQANKQYHLVTQNKSWVN